jgi:hypothetical protein
MKKQTKEETRRLRDHRRPGWFWAENELFDVFQPLIGPMGVSVYLALCREARSGSVKLSLREIQKLAGVSKDTASRVLGKMVVLGMVGETRSGIKAPSTYDLFDLKDAAALGSLELAKRLSVAERDSAVEKRREERRPSPESTVAVGDSADATPAFSASNAVETDVSLPETDLSHPAAHLSHRQDAYIRQDFKTKTNTPLPPASVGREERTDRVSEPQTLVEVRAHLAELVPGMREPCVANSAASPLQAARVFLDELHEEFARTMGVRPSPAMVRNGWEDPYEAWQRCFEHVAVGDVESDGDVPVVTLLTRRPSDLAAGLARYSARVKLAMHRAFGREVQLVPRDEAVAA